MTPTRRYVLLLATLTVMLVVQPLLAHGSLASRVAYDALFGASVVGVLFAVLRSAWERRVGIALALPALVSNVAHYALHGGLTTTAAAVYHISMAGFVGFAMVAILREIFARRGISTGDILGAFAGYALVGIAFGNFFAVADLLVPGSFSVNPSIASATEEWHERRALFDYFSFTTLTSLGFGDITPIAPPATTLSWLEVIIGQFYIAVVVAQVVGLKLAQTRRANGAQT